MFIITRNRWDTGQRMQAVTTRRSLLPQDTRQAEIRCLWDCVNKSLSNATMTQVSAILLLCPLRCAAFTFLHGFLIQKKKKNSQSLPLLFTESSLVTWFVSHDHSSVSSKESGIVMTGPDYGSFLPLSYRNSTLTSYKVLKSGVPLTKWSGEGMLSREHMLSATIVPESLHEKERLAKFKYIFMWLIYSWYWIRISYL